MSPLQHSTNIAARMGRWSARHRKTAIFGWLAFVVASFAIGTAVGMQTIEKMHAAGAACLVLEPGKTIILERAKVMELADRYKIAIVGYNGSDTTPAPV